MSYNVIDKQLGIYSCSIKDLTVREAACFLEQWEDGATLSDLTLFLSEGRLVINEDNTGFNQYVELARIYLQASDKKCEQIQQSASVEMEESLRILKHYREKQVLRENLRILGKQPVAAYDNALVSIARESSAKSWFALVNNCYNWGVIQGKRSERAKRKKNRMI